MLLHALYTCMRHTTAAPQADAVINASIASGINHQHTAQKIIRKKLTCALTRLSSSPCLPAQSWSEGIFGCLACDHTHTNNACKMESLRMHAMLENVTLKVLPLSRVHCERLRTSVLLGGDSCDV